MNLCFKGVHFILKSGPFITRKWTFYFVRAVRPNLLNPRSGIAGFNLMLGHTSFYNTPCLTINTVWLLACWFMHTFLYGCGFKSA